ncbi:MAG: cyclic nucleotide-binding domain-containing protein [Alphaproteobacteria bacterium]
MADNIILERVAIHAGKTFIHAGEKNTDSFIVQEGEVCSFIIENGKKLIIDTFSSGSIIAETNLLINESEVLNYEAIKNSTVVKITRQDFEIKMKKLDSSLFNVITHLVQKLKVYEMRWTEKTIQAKQNDMKAMEIVDYLLRDMSTDRRTRYQEILLPHFNIMVKALDELKQEERDSKQKKALENSIAKSKEDKKDD